MTDLARQREAMSGPTTEAGRALHADRQYHAAGLVTCPRWSLISDDDAPCECDLPHAILAIEAEAHAAGRAEALGELAAGISAALTIRLLRAALAVAPAADPPLVAAKLAAQERLDVERLAEALYRAGLPVPKHRGSAEWYAELAEGTAREYRAATPSAQDEGTP